MQNLYATGLFYNIRVTDENTPEGVVLTYIVQAKPRLTEIQLPGQQEVQRCQTAEKVTSKVGEPLDERKLFTDTQEIQKMYQKAGYPGTQVKYVLNIDEKAGTGTATFDIKEGQKIRIVDVEFVGAAAFSQRESAQGDQDAEALDVLVDHGQRRVQGGAVRGRQGPVARILPSTRVTLISKSRTCGSSIRLRAR